MHRLRLLGGLLIAGLASSAMAEPPMSAQDFLNAAAQSDQYEIQAGRVVVAMSEDAQLRAFAQQMIDDHSKTTETLKSAAAAAGLPPPPEIVGGDQQKMLSALQSVKGDDLARTYVTQQIMAHTSALVTEQAYAASGDEPHLRQAAQAATPLIQHHLEMAQQMKGAKGAD